MCAAPTNFLQWNPNKRNQEDDLTYLSETQRTDGAVTGVFPSVLGNKLFYQCTTMVAALAQMMVNKGFEIQDAVIADLITSLSHILTDAQFGSSAGTVCQGNDPRLDRELPTDTKVWFWQNVAPTGWTIDATAAADAVLAVKAGSGTYAVAGGSQAGTWTQPNHTHTVDNHTHTVDNHTHTVGNHTHTVGNHTHTIAHYHTVRSAIIYPQGGGSSPCTILTGDSSTNQVAGGVTSGSTGPQTSSSSGAQTSSSSGAQTSSSSGAQTSSSSATANTWRPVANVGIICSRNA